jgi:class 3 adenylate cyclase
MGLRAKIFAAFSVVVFGLLGTVVYVTNTETEAFETKRIIRQLDLARDRFQQRLDEQRTTAFVLVQTITSDQKYRAFLEDMKDNFFSFAEEIARDTNSGLVIVVDDELEISGVSRPVHNRDDMEDHVERVARSIKAEHLESVFDEVIETGEGQTHVIALGEGLANAVFVPLKESPRDDYALGVVMVANQIDDDWVRNLLGNEVDDFTVAFFAGDRAIASDASQANRQALVDSATAEELSRVTLQSDRHIALRALFETAGLPAGYIVAGNLDRALKPIGSLQRELLIVGFIVLVVGMLIAFGVSARIVQPIRKLVDATHHVMDGDFSYRVANPSSDEVGELSTAFQNMVEGLQEKEQIRNLFGKYVHPSIVSGLIDNPDELGVDGRHQVQTLLFSDIQGFVGISANMDAEETVDLLNEYLGQMTEEITRTDGILDKYLGDGIMSFFGPPFTPGNHAYAACRAAIRMQRRLTELRPDWVARGIPEINARIGLATGEVIVGNIGSEQTRDYTCIGETVNLASRLEGVNKYYGTRIIIDAGTRDLAGKAVNVRELDVIKVMGSEDPVRIFELWGFDEDETADQVELRATYDNAMIDYRAGRFEDAAAVFDILASEPTADPPSQTMALRCRSFVDEPPQDWKGVYAMDKK